MSGHQIVVAILCALTARAVWNLGRRAINPRPYGITFVIVVAMGVAIAYATYQ